MEKNKHIYITTPIYYASGTPHLGHAYTTILADCFVKYYQLRGFDTRFTTGTDEYGLKIERAALNNEKTPRQFVDELAEKFKDSWKQLDINYDDFIRTTEERHKKVVHDLWKKMDDNGDIYLGHYEGLYCIDCEQYYRESELLEGKLCPIHNKLVDNMKEETYFFRLSKYQKKLLDHIEQNPDFIFPETRRNEVLGFLKNNQLQDLSISRTSFSWGIPVPGDQKHIIYVWVDALTNYISSLGGFDSELFKKYWPNTVHFIGKDILRFHAVYWPCFLMSAGIELPKSLIVHGWWTISNRKISKSDPATKINPNVLVEGISADGLRYFLIKELTVGRDGDMSYENLISSLNAGLANNLGNLVNRTVQMIHKYFNGKLTVEPNFEIHQEDKEVQEQAFEMTRSVEKLMAENNPSAALQAIMGFSNFLNLYLEKTAPWQLAKQQDQKQRMQIIFLHIIESLRWISNVGYPFFPKLSNKIKAQIGLEEKLEWPEQFVLKDFSINSASVLFNRITKDREAELIEQWRNSKKSSEV